MRSLHFRNEPNKMTQVVLTTWCVWVCYLRTRRTGCGTASFTLPNFKSNINTQKAKFSHFASAKNPTTLNLHLVAFCCGY